MRWHWLRTLSKNPIYLREKGGWGRPNPFFDKLNRFSPFVILGALGFGICAGVVNPALIAGDTTLGVFWCLLCLPGILLNSLTMFATLMAPALTAPAVSMEINRGTWEILRVTPQTSRGILLAKLFGALGRLRIWRVLAVLSLLQGLLMAGAALLGGGPIATAGPVLGLTTAVRPWVEVLFAGLGGMYISTRVRTTSTALAFSYAIVVIVKVLNSSGLWMSALSMLDLDEAMLFAGSVGPATLYILLAAGLWAGLMRQADRLEYG